MSHSMERLARLLAKSLRHCFTQESPDLTLSRKRSLKFAATLILLWELSEISLKYVEDRRSGKTSAGFKCLMSAPICFQALWLQTSRPMSYMIAPVRQGYRQSYKHLQTVSKHRWIETRPMLAGKHIPLERDSHS